jgi:hypothetical protein
VSRPLGSAHGRRARIAGHRPAFVAKTIHTGIMNNMWPWSTAILSYASACTSGAFLRKPVMYTIVRAKTNERVNQLERAVR